MGETLRIVATIWKGEGGGEGGREREAHLESEWVAWLYRYMSIYSLVTELISRFFAKSEEVCK